MVESDTIGTPPSSSFVRDTPSTATSTPGHRKNPSGNAPPLPWTPAPYQFDAYAANPYSANPYMQPGWDWWMGDGMHFPVSMETMAAVRAAQVAAGMYDAASMMDMSAVDAMSLHSPSGKKERKRGQKGKSGPSQLSNPSRPRLQELRNLPQRGLGLRWVSDDRKFQVVKLQQTTTSASPGPAATVVRPDPDGVLEASGGSNLPALTDLKSSVVCWAVDNWVARRFEASPAEPEWQETECVALDNNEAGTQEEWARRFSQREKQLLVGKGTRGYRRFLRMIPKQNRKPGDPQTPRVAEQCSKRAFDGRLKQWRILLHAFSPRESEDEAEEGEPIEVVPEDTNLMEELHKALVKESQVQIPPTPPKPTALLSPSSKERTPGTPLSKGSRKSPNGTVASQRTMTPMPPVTPSRPADVERSTPTSNSLPVVPGFPFPGFSPPPMDYASPLPSPAQIDAMSQLPPGSLDLMMGPEFKELAEQLAQMGTLPAESLNASIGALLLNQEVPPPNLADETGMADGHLLPTDLLHEGTDEPEETDLETTLQRAKVPEDLKPIFKEAFANVHHAFSKNTDEREVILANAARAVIGSMPPTEQAPLKVLDTLLAFLNELRASYGNPKTQGA